VIEGNYSWLLPQRLDRATGFILLDVPTTTSLYRYVRRCWFERDRRGALEGGRDSVKWNMIRHIIVATRANRIRYRNMIDGISLPRMQIANDRGVGGLLSCQRLEALSRVFSFPHANGNARTVSRAVPNWGDRIFGACAMFRRSI
jgi:adenylate kinase family enzyme